MKSNIKELLLKSLVKTNKKDQIISSIVFKSIGDIFFMYKNIDIKKDIISIQVRGNTFLVKTQNPLINHEILLIQDKIIDDISKKFQNIGISHKNLILKLK